MRIFSNRRGISKLKPTPFINVLSKIYTMQVVKRSGKKETVSFDKITARVNKLCYGLNQDHIKPLEISQKVVQGLYDGVSTTELDNLAAETAASMSTKHPDYALLAARIAISNLHKNTNKSFSETMEALYNYIDPKTGQKAGLIGESTYQTIPKPVKKQGLLVKRLFL